MGRSNEEKEANSLEELRHTTSTTNIETTSSPTRHKISMHSAPRAFGAAAPASNYSTTPGRPPTPPYEVAVPMYHRSSSSHNAARPSHPQPKLHRENCS
jgi:hypothetical protein